eukprot:8665758-Lingulodinium_polyedra.AAC.1
MPKVESNITPRAALDEQPQRRRAWSGDRSGNQGRPDSPSSLLWLGGRFGNRGRPDRTARC